MRFWPLTTNERAENNHTHCVEFTADDLTTAVANTAQTIVNGPGTGPMWPFQIGDIVKRVTVHLKTPFENTADAAFNTTTMSIGDSVGGVATILAAIELNLNGTEIIDKTAVPAGTPATGFTAATNLTFTFNSMAAKLLSALNKGNVVILLDILRPGTLYNAIAANPINTK